MDAITDKELLEAYYVGWLDCSYGVKHKRLEDVLIQRAYTIGYLDYLAGDEVSSLDRQNEWEILKNIKDL